MVGLQQEGTMAGEGRHVYAGRLFAIYSAKVIISNSFKGLRVCNCIMDQEAEEATISLSLVLHYANRV